MPVSLALIMNKFNKSLLIAKSYFLILTNFKKSIKAKQTICFLQNPGQSLLQ